MNEYLYALNLKNELEKFKSERMQCDKNYICVFQYINLEILKKKILDVGLFMKICRKFGLKADYPQNLEECLKEEYEGKNLIALVLY